MSDNESDEDLKRAIALSLADQPESSSSKKAVVIDLISSDEDEDDNLDAPVIARKITSTKVISNKKEGLSTEASTSHTQKPKIASDHASSQKTNIRTDMKPPSGAADISPSPNPSPLTLLGLDRKKMEEERLLRIQQRTKPDQQISTPGPEGRKRKASPSLPHPSSQRSKPSDSKVASDDRPLSSAQGAPLPIPSPREHERSLGVEYPDGVVKKTWVQGSPRQGDDIKFEEVLQKNDLELAVLSAFQIEPDWVASKLKPETKVVFVLQAKTEMEKENIKSGAPSNYRFCFPSMEGNVNCMHSKLQLLSHPRYLRVVVPSANLVPYDWGETGSMENICFLIDLPRLPDNRPAEPEPTEFAKELFHFVQAMGLDDKLIGSLKKFDFSRTSHLAFVHSIGGSHSGNAIKRTGYCGLGSAVRNLGLQTDETLDIAIVSASIGNLNNGFVSSIYLAAQGDDGMKEYGWRTSRPAKSKAQTPAEHKLSELMKDCLRIYFPTRETVANSKGGLGGAGTICFQSKWYDMDTFPKHLMRDCQSRRRGLLMHSKMIFVHPRDVGLSDGKAWAYVGSANLSESAWGRLVKDRTTKQPKLNCRNWECGVLVSGFAATPARLAMSGINQHNLSGTGVFGGHVPVPMVVPGDEYGTQRPWFYNEA